LSGLTSFLAGAISIVSPAGLPSLALVLPASLLIPLRLARPNSMAFLLGCVVYVTVAGAELGTIWPALDRPQSALSEPLAWVCSLALLLAAWPRLGAWRISVLLGCCAALRPAVYGPQWLLAQAHGSAPELLLYHLGGGLTLVVVWIAVSALLGRLVGERGATASTYVYSGAAVAALSGIYGVLLRELIARWPASLVG